MTAPVSKAFERPPGTGAQRQRAPQRPWQPARPVTDPVKSAQAAGLEYIGDDLPGIRRVRRGKGFSYVGADSRPIPAIVDAYLDGSLAATLKAYAALPAAELPPGLSADGAAVLALRPEKLGQAGAGDDSGD